ncbi:Pol polyprotein [Plakobranchus ocellatus]|uniref:Pol polyprotein n=1 Tax=Plakobranchus ocellatus TaxID=259542 RepID=A0AAV4CJ03_9GAST|nr:Pol polyprotein [Plakobranchus ocellatus]
MSELLHSVKGLICLMDHILIHSSDKAAHDEIKEVDLTFNNKCEFSKPSINFYGHIIAGQGIRADAAKAEAILKFLVLLLLI